MLKSFFKIQNPTWRSINCPQSSNQYSSVYDKILIYSENAPSTEVMISRLKLNQPANVALTRSMLRNPGCNNSFVYGQIIEMICPLEPVDFIPSSATKIAPTQHLKMSILAGSGRFWRAFFPNQYKGMEFKKRSNKF